MFPIYTLDKLKVKKFEAVETEKIGEGSYGKIYLHNSKVYKLIRVSNDDEINAALNEITIHETCYRVRSRVRKNDLFMAKIPKIYDVFRQNVTKPDSPSMDIIVVMENVGESFHKVMERKINNLTNGVNKTILRQTCAVVYQLSELIKLLQKKLRFSHRDLHTSNVMLTPSTETNECGDSLYNVYMIDFGFARIDIGNRTFYGDSYFETTKFAPRFDLTLFIFDVFYYTFRCKILGRKRVTCTRTLPQNVLNLWERILFSTGIQFHNLLNSDVEQTVDRAKLYDIIMDHHQPAKELTSIPFIQKQVKLLIYELCSSATP
jgi:serine/threonine protein kinase